MQGVSQAQFFAQFLGNIKLNDAPVDWAALDLRYLLKVRYSVGRYAVAKHISTGCALLLIR
jgi:hypothetical protein